MASDLIRDMDTSWQASHLTFREAESEIWIDEDLSLIGKENLRYDAEVMGDYRPFPGTSKLLSTENTPGTPFARSPARFLSDWRSTTPSKVTCPRFTMM